MIHALAFRLRVPSQDEHTLTDHTSTSYTFRGLMRLEPGMLYIEWTGTGKRETHGLLDNQTDVLTLPLESFELPLEQVRLLNFHGGWWWPRVILSATSLDALRVIPSEEDGVVKFYIARSDRAAAEALIAAVLAQRNV